VLSDETEEFLKSSEEIKQHAFKLDKHRKDPRSRTNTRLAYNQARTILKPQEASIDTCKP
jgi:hypothetical protein